MQPIKVLSVAAIDHLAERLPHQCPHFLLLLAWNAPNIPEEKLTRLLRPLVDRGLVYFCAWGANCEAIHDAVDHADMERHQEAGEELTDETILLTTWHARDSLAEALWFFKVCALPASSFNPNDCDRFAVSIGHPDWEAELEREVQSIEHDADGEVEPFVVDEDD